MCLWKTDEFGELDMSQLKIDSEVATDNDKEEFLEILRTGIVNKEMKSKYACNFRFFLSLLSDIKGWNVNLSTKNIFNGRKFILTSSEENKYGSC